MNTPDDKELKREKDNAEPPDRLVEAEGGHGPIDAPRGESSDTRPLPAAGAIGESPFELVPGALAEDVKEVDEYLRSNSLDPQETEIINAMVAVIGSVSPSDPSPTMFAQKGAKRLKMVEQCVRLNSSLGVYLAREPPDDTELRNKILKDFVIQAATLSADEMTNENTLAFQELKKHPAIIFALDSTQDSVFRDIVIPAIEAKRASEQTYR